VCRGETETHTCLPPPPTIPLSLFAVYLELVCSRPLPPDANVLCVCERVIEVDSVAKKKGGVRMGNETERVGER